MRSVSHNVTIDVNGECILIRFLLSYFQQELVFSEISSNWENFRFFESLFDET